MAHSINKDYGFSVSSAGMMGDYTLKFREDYGDSSSIYLDISDINQGLSVDITDEQSATLNFNGSIEMEDFANFCREVAQTYDEFKKLTSKIV